MYFEKGYKYQLTSGEVFDTSFRPKEVIQIPFITLYPHGTMIVHAGFAFDGPTGTLDRKTNMYPACGHDALYKLMRQEKIPFHLWPLADEDYCTWLTECGAWPITVSINRAGLKLMKGKYAHPKNQKKVHHSPSVLPKNVHK